MNSNDKKIALVTGANKGLGFEISRQLAKQEIKVILGARDSVRGQQAADKLKQQGLDADFHQIDVTDVASIEATRDDLEKHFGKLDILINNAGITGGLGPVSPSQMSLDDIRTVFETNFFGVITVKQTLLPLIRKSDAGRIVNMSSGLGSLTNNSNPNWEFYNVKPLNYNASKTALNAFTVMLAYELKDTPIKVNSADPDFCRTDLNNNTGIHSPEEGADTPVWLATLPADGPSGGFFNSRQPVPW